MSSEGTFCPASEPFRGLERLTCMIQTKISLALTVLAAALLLPNAVQAQPAVPDSLEPWRDWVLFGQEFRDCPVLNGRDPSQEAFHVCAWPGRLEIEVSANGASFEQNWNLYRDEWVPLPGDSRYWPAAVTIDGEQQAAVLRGNRPTVRVPAGQHRITGELDWQTRPASIPVPTETGLIALALDGEAVAIPELERGVLWLGLRPDLVVQEDRLTVQVYRVLNDAIPVRMVTRIQLDVAGQSREIELNGAMIEGFIGESLRADLPAELETDGTLRMQVRPGRWEATIVAHHPSMPTEFTRPALVDPWPQDEIWSFSSNPVLRVAMLEGAPAVDSQRAGVPREWNNLPSYAVAPDSTLNLVERSRNDAIDDNSLGLVRYLWLDFDGQGFTAEDRVSGQLRNGWRLDMAAPYAMTMASMGNQNLLVTAGEEAATQGVELRTTNLQLTTTARLPSNRTLPVTGYTEPFDAAQTTLFLPPAWRLLAAPGADVAVGAWIERWRLLDIFLAMIIAVASWRILGAVGGGVALVALVLTYHEPLAPHYIWLNLLLITALLRVVPEGQLKHWCGRYRFASLVLLGLALIPFTAMQLRIVIFPQLEQAGVARNLSPQAAASPSSLGASIANLRGLNTDFGTRTLTLADERRMQESANSDPETVTVTGTRIRRDDFSAANATTVITGEDMNNLGTVSVADMVNQLPGNIATVSPEATADDPFYLGASIANMRGQNTAFGTRTLTQLEQNASRYQPGALLQTGPGLPDWGWTRYTLGFTGPIERDDTVSLVMIGPWLVGAWRIASVALALGLAWLLLRAKPGTRPGGAATSPSGKRKSAAAACLALTLILPLASLPTPGVAQTSDGFPPLQLLEELRTRLTAPAPCHPSCAELSDARVEIDGDQLSMTLEVALQDNLAIPVPGDASGWQANDIVVDGASRQLLYRENGGRTWLELEAGVRQLSLTGPVPAGDSLTLAFPLTPRRVQVEAPGWDIAGIAEGRLLSGSIELIRQRQAEDGDDDTIQATAFPPFVRVTRNFMFGIDWTVTTTAARVAPLEGAFTIGIDLLPDEAVSTENIEVENGVATIAFAAGQNSVSWQSRLETAPELALTATQDDAWSETWSFNVGHEWHAEFDGLPSTQARSVGSQLLIEYLPRPGESLNVDLARPEPVSGDTIAIDNLVYRRSVGDRTSTSTLDFTYRSTRSIDHPIVLPPASELESVTIDATALPLRLDERTLSLPIAPGAHQVQINWRNPEGVGFNSSMPAVDLGAGISNLTFRLAMPGDRWTLLTFGPTLGPAVLYWAELAVFVLAAVLLGRLKLSPLRTHEWLLLGLGLSTFSWPVLLLFAVWAFLMKARNSQVLSENRIWFNTGQVLLALLTLATVGALISSIANGLLGTPNMHIVTPVSGGPLSWFADRSDGITTSVGAVSVSLWFYKAAMLAWALWLSFAVLRWLRWAWTAYSHEGFWRGRVATKPAS